jgi:hypothetical protein
MKIYIDNIHPEKITSNKLIALEEYNFEKKEVLEIYSEKGMYLVENQKVFKLFPINEKIHKIIENEIIYLLDETTIEKQQYSQIPMEHVCDKKIIYMYHLKNLRLIIEGCIKREETILTKILSTEYKYDNFIVTNFYFEPKNGKLDINDLFIKNEINVFLSVLN